MDIVLNKEATAEAVLAENFDEVVIATGALPRTLAIEAEDDSVQICNAEDILKGNVEPGKDIIVIGGGAVGCETAQYMGRQGTLSPEQVYYMMLHHVETPERISELMETNARNISIVEMTKKIGSNGFDPGTAWPCIKDLKRLKVNKYPLTVVKSIGGHAAVLVTKTEEGEKEFRIPCDTVVLSVGYRPNNALYEDLKDKLDHVHVIGDAEKVGKIKDATTAGLRLAVGI